MKTKNAYETMIPGWSDVVAETTEGRFDIATRLPADATTARDVTTRVLQRNGVPGGVDVLIEPHYCDRGITYYIPGIRVVAGRTRETGPTLGAGLDKSFRRAARASGLDTETCRAWSYRWRSYFRPARDTSETFIERIRQKPLTPATFRYERAVGIEIESFGPISQPDLISRLPVWCSVVGDGSIRPTPGNVAHEIRALLTRSELEPRLFRLCRTLGALGMQVNKSCGLHVHLDMRGQTLDGVTKKAKIMDAWLSSLQELVPASRRNNDYCRFGVSQTCRYRAVNLKSFTSHNTLEIRLHSGSIDYTKILAWVRLLELLAALRSKPKVGGCIAVLEQLPLAAHDLAYWRARHAALNPHLYGSSVAEESE